MNVTDVQWHVLQGQLQAMKAGMFALINAHPRKDVIAESLRNAQISAEAAALPKPVPDEFVRAMQRMLDEFVTAATASQGSAGGPHRSDAED